MVGGGVTEHGFYFKCMVCGLQAEYRSNEPIPSTYNKAVMNSKVAAAWKAWFNYKIKSIIDSGEYPQWLRAGRPQRVEDSASITEDDF